MNHDDLMDVLMEQTSFLNKVQILIETLKYNNNLQMIYSHYDLIDHQVRNINLLQAICYVMPPN